MIERLKSTAVAAIMLTLLAACATHRGPTASGVSEQHLFATADERAVFQAAYDALVEGFPSAPVQDIDGPIRGFTLTRKWALDYWTTTIRVFPATGVTSDGRAVAGYYVEVSGDGTLILRGPSMDKRVYEAAQRQLGQLGRKEVVSQLTRGTYQLERDRWRLNAQPSLRDGGTINIAPASNGSAGSRSVADRLRELEALRREGKVTEQEFNSLRAEILRDL